MSHGGHDLRLATLEKQREFYGVSGDPVLFRYTKDVGGAVTPEVRGLRAVGTYVARCLTQPPRCTKSLNKAIFFPAVFYRYVCRFIAV